MFVPFKEILKDAYSNKYAVGAFNCLSLENAMGAIQAAEELRSPIIIQLAEVQFPYSPMEKMAPVFIESAEKASVPVCVHLDHGQSLETCVRAMKLGFQSIMYDGANLPLEENIRNTKEIVRIARALNVDIEAELGKVGNANSEQDNVSDIFTDVDESAYFIKETAVDALAIAIGNLHGKYVATPQLNIERLQEINNRNRLPLVLHGGSGTSFEDFKSCIHNGICKINVATAIQIAVTNKLEKYFKTVSNPNYIDMKYQMVEASKEAVIEHMLLFESNGKA
ncbi:MULTISPECIES: class II fructose-bisphosphate aldolase [Culturomica]|jgi:fructose-bisphosphate aldolase class II|uniref:class II fructose-bisphosphate aldolase n=3 Tax=Odoribacteraceae TaxID=1853231 RepID=UPI0003406B11|nr:MULTISPECIES: class II fructose-bisphosphate aldolase [Culturomica]CCZ06463.1 fructose-bisphosphate aldolase [Odoribacter sp. CAG:788]HBO25309.1 class II fructose-bisphosphate aldolase [Culturomica sp.]